MGPFQPIQLPRVCLSKPNALSPASSPVLKTEDTVGEIRGAPPHAHTDRTIPLTHMVTETWSLPCPLPRCICLPFSLLSSEASLLPGVYSISLYSCLGRFVSSHPCPDLIPPTAPSLHLLKSASQLIQNLLSCSTQACRTHPRS